MKIHFKHHLLNMVISAVLFGAVTGTLAAVVVLLYKLCAMHVIELSEKGYAALRLHPLWIPLVLLALVGLAWICGFIYRKRPNLGGGGIPTSIGILRGLIPFKWFGNLIGIFTLSLTNFLIGVPLGNEGPAVQMGTAVGKGAAKALSKKHRAWDRYSMTGGACAGFSVATGAPISGILFSVEEAHQRLSPTILIVSSTSVMFASIVTDLLAPILNVSTRLFPVFSLPRLTLAQVWIPMTIGIAMGLFSVLFLKYYHFIYTLFHKKLKKLNNGVKILLVFAATLLLGLASSSFISTGHHLILSLMDGTIILPMLILILLVRATLTLSASSCSLTGGMFLPILAIGTLLAAILAETFEACGLSNEFHTVIILWGLTACIAGMMKTPLTAIVFAVEALSCYENILFVIIVAAIPFLITEIFGAKSINDSVLERRIEKTYAGKSKRVIDTFVTVQADAYAIGKQVRDILWPANLFVLSTKHTPKADAEVDEHGGMLLGEGDIIHVRYVTYHVEQTHQELEAIVGEQQFAEIDADVI